MLTKVHEYADQGQERFVVRYRQRVVAHVNRRAQELGMKFVLPLVPEVATTRARVRLSHAMSMKSTTWECFLSEGRHLGDATSYDF